tara:strand:- start:1626 stop:2282 length:657 start_codon:yes stop_codon:yes gene_type:complete
MGKNILMAKLYLYLQQHHKSLMEHFLKLIPEKSKKKVVNLLHLEPVIIKVAKKRISKHGDFRKKANGDFFITINESTNPYRFLITLLHEIAHYIVYKKYLNTSKPHGPEWKLAYRKILLPFLNNQIFPDQICRCLAHYIKNPKASTDRDLNLFMALRQYDKKENGSLILEIEKGQIFRIKDGRKFIKLKKRRKLYECRDMNSNRIFLFSPLAEVIPSL